MSTFAAGIIASAILIMMFVMPIALISRKKNTSAVSEVVIGMAVIGVCVVLEWFPVWIFILITLIIALLFSGKLTSLVGGD